MMIITGICVLLYASLIMFLVYGIKKYRPDAKLKKDVKTNFSFSVIIPCKNEGKRLLPLLQSIKDLAYKNEYFELIFINDHSDDGTFQLISQFKRENDRLDVKLLNNVSSAGKKSAIRLGIDRSKYDYIVTTDADCYLSDDWLTGFNQHLNNKKSAMIIAPVVYRNPNNFLEQFQHDDFLSLQAITIATARFQKPILCNGANLCYKKSVFYEISGFDQHQLIASGDDVLLMESFINNKFKVDYINKRVQPVITQPVNTWKELLNQRKRWSSKIGKSSNKLNYGLLLVIWIYSFLFVLILISVFFGLRYFQYFFTVILSKWILDYILFSSLSKKINILLCFKNMMLSSCFYPLWIVFFSIISIDKSYIWKDQNFKF